MMDWAALISSGLALLVYLNTLPAEFAYDDSRAILKNPDLLPDTPLSHVFYDDFWGTPLTHTGSHKSYRPLCVLTFRLNYHLGGFNPVGYHLTNVILHALVTAVYVPTVRDVVGRHRRGSGLVALLAGVLFAVHPIHSEAVAGIVGRADVLSALFFLLAFRSYSTYCRLRDVTAPSTAVSSGGDLSTASNVIQNGSGTASCSRGSSPSRDCSPAPDGGRRARWLYVVGCLTLSGASMLSKEHGVTVLAVCAVYDVFIHSRLHPSGLLSCFYKSKYRHLFEGLTVLTAMAATLIGVRVLLMGCQAPEFSPSDNPASDSDSFLTRLLTFTYLPLLNIWLLLCPSQLSFDWSMGSVPLVESFYDPRNLMTSCFYVLLFAVSFRILRSVCTANRRCDLVYSAVLTSGNGHHHNHEYRQLEKEYCKPETPNGSNGAVNGAAKLANGGKTEKQFSAVEITQSHVLLLAMALLVLPFIPATNILFYVGFVIAERVLYIPSMGFCILVAVGLQSLLTARIKFGRSRTWKIAINGAVVLLIVSFSIRTFSRNQDWLTEEALYRSGISINPAKAWGNLANVLNGHGRIQEAEHAYKAALNYRSNMADVHYNLGILYQEQARYNEAIESYKMAIQCRPRLTMAHLNLGIVFATVGMKSEAEQVYRICAQIDISSLKDPRLHEQTKISALYNLGRLLDDQGRHREAIEIYLEAIEKLPSHYAPQSLYNMLGEAYAKVGDWNHAEHWYREALRVKPDHIPAHLTLAKLLQRKGQFEKSEQLFMKARLFDPNDSSTHQHYGQFLSDVGRYVEAAESYLIAAQLSPSDFELIFNTASALRQAGRNAEAENFYRRSVELRPDMALAHMNLGAMLHFNGKLLEAESSYLTALELQPDDDVTRANLNKLRNRLRRQ